MGTIVFTYKICLNNSAQWATVGTLIAYKHPAIPDYKKYKIDGIKELEWVQAELAKKGLKDPWIRNQAWRYMTWPGEAANWKGLLLRGFKPAAAMMLVTIAVDQLLGISKMRHPGDVHH